MNIIKDIIIITLLAFISYDCFIIVQEFKKISKYCTIEEYEYKG